MQKTKNQVSIQVKTFSLINPITLRSWLYILLAVGLALAGWFLLSRLSRVGASAANAMPSNGGVTHIWPTEVINTPMASGRSFVHLTGSSLAYYSGKTKQELHLVFAAKDLFYTKSEWDGTKWTDWITPRVIYSSSEVSEWVSIAVDAYNRPHIAFYTIGITNTGPITPTYGKLMYATLVDEKWYSTTVDDDRSILPLFEDTNDDLSDDAGSITASDDTSPKGGVGKYVSIAVDSHNRPHISYTKFYPRKNFDDNLVRTYHKLKYAFCIDSVSCLNNNNWIKQQVYENKDQLRSLNEGLYTSISIDSRDRPHIAFLDDDHDKLRYAFSPRDGQWLFSYPFDPSQYEPNIGGWNSIVTRPAKPQDKVYIAFYDKTNGALRMVEGIYSYDSNYKLVLKWNKFLVDQSGDVGLFASLADKNGKDFGISYFDESWDDLRFALGSGTKWSTGIVTGTNSRAGRYTSLVFDFNQKPHITYFDFSDGMLYEAYQITTTWKFRPIDLSDTLGSAAVSLDTAKNPNVLYYNDLLGSLEVARRSTSWTADTVVASRLSTDQRVAFRVDSSGRSHLAYYEPLNQDLVYGIKDGLAWNFETLDSLGDVGQNPALALDSANNPYISYYDATNGQVKLAFKNSSDKWVTEVIGGVGNAAGSFSSIVVHPTTKALYVTFYDANSQSLKLAYTQSGDAHTWTVSEVDSSPKSGWHNSLALDANGNPLIAYYEASNKVLKFAAADGSTPPFNFTVTAVDTSGQVGQYCSLGVDGNGQYHISYYDEANRDLKYALFDGSEWSIQIVAFAGDVGMWSSLVIDPSTNIPHILYFDSTNGQWKYTIDKPRKIEAQVFLPLIGR